MTLRVRDLHEGEAEELVRMTRSRTLGAGLVRRGRQRIPRRLGIAATPNVTLI